VVPYHHPIVMAKAIATLDHLSGGRVDFAIGVGHAEREFEVLGVPFDQRGEIADEYIDVMIELWTADLPRFAGAHVAFDDIVFEPKPAQRPHPPIFVGGNSKAALKRAARVGDGWFPWLITPEQLPGCLEELQAQPGFDPAKPFDVIMGVSNVNVDEHHVPVDGGEGRPRVIVEKQALVDAIGHLVEIGVTSTSVPPPRTSSMGEYMDHVQWVAEEILPLFPEIEPASH
jgi:probable F420-dependent oxidoreductase